MRLTAIGFALLLLSACDEPVGNDAAPQPDPVAAAPSVPPSDASADNGPDPWSGRWIGPEGTYLLITRQRDRYTLEIADLDGPKHYTALDVGDRLEFERNGKVERIRATDGRQTGMKWLQDKSDCLTIKPGEGYCRDPN